MPKHADFFFVRVWWGSNKKVLEKEKKALTNGGWFGILPKLSVTANAVAVSTKKEFEKIQRSA